MINTILLTITLAAVMTLIYLVLNTKDRNKNDFTKEDAATNTQFINNAINASSSAISEKINKRLNDITEKTTMIKASHENSTKVIENLKNDVNSFNDLLFNKKLRGGYGEAQLKQILYSIYGDNKNYYTEQYEYDSKIIDVAIFLPNDVFIPVDSKFPYENFIKIDDENSSQAEKDAAIKRFNQDVKGRVKETAKYIVEGKTTDYAIMFIPSESVFSYIFANAYDVVDFAKTQNVLIVSPTTMNAVISNIKFTTEIIEQSKNAKEIREQIIKLSTDFNSLNERWTQLDKKINEIITKKDNVGITVKKISSKFDKITKTEK